MRSIVFDTGPLISLAMNNLLWILKPLKENFRGEFFITEAVRKECVERPLSSKKYRFEAIQILKLIQEGIIKLYTSDNLITDTNLMMDLANRLFRAQGEYIKNVQFAEMEAVVCAKLLTSEAVVIDEFITRSLIENPLSVKDRMEKKLHLEVYSDKQNIFRFREEVRGIKVIRSFELAISAYELGLFDDFILEMQSPRKTLLEGVLWALKLNGCSATELEIEEAISIEKVK